MKNIKENREQDRTPIYMCIGMLLGGMVGYFAWNNIVLGFCFGVGIGIPMGSILEVKRKRGKFKSEEFIYEENIAITCSAFKNGAVIPEKYTCYGNNLSPELRVPCILPEAKSIAVMLDDIDHPLFGIYNHWCAWNLPVCDTIQEGIPHGATLPDGTKQGIAYGIHCYKGPKPPMGTHHYKFHVFVLDSMLDIEMNSGKKELVEAMKTHILQYGTLTGKYR